MVKDAYDTISRNELWDAFRNELMFTPLKILNGTPKGVPSRTSMATLPINELKKAGIVDACPILNLHQCKTRGELNRLYEQSMQSALAAEGAFGEAVEDSVCFANASHPSRSQNEPVRVQPSSFAQFASTPAYATFRSDLMSMFDGLKRVNSNQISSKPEKLIAQCKLVMEIYQYLLSNKDFIAENKQYFRKLGPNNKLSMLDATVERCGFLSNQIEDLYDELYDEAKQQSKRINPTLRRTKNETIALIQQVSEVMDSIR
jgi:hypothetical protein